MAGNLGTGFPTSGFTFEPNLSPNNQVFAAAVRAVLANLSIATPFNGTTTALGTGVFANPTVKVSTTATNGAATTAMRSDGAPAIDQAMSPVWSGTHVFDGGNPTPILVGTSTVYGWGGGTQYGAALQVGRVGGIQSEVATPSLRLWGGAYWNGTNAIYTGTNTNNSGTSTGAALVLGGGQFLVQFWGPGGTFGGTATGVNLFAVNGTVQPTFRGYGPTAATLVDMTPDTATFNGTGTGFSNATVFSCRWSKNGLMVAVTITAKLGTSNSTSFSIGQLPAAITPAVNQQGTLISWLEDNGAIVQGSYTIAPSGSIIFYKGAGVTASASWTGSGQKGFGADTTFVYGLG